MCAQHKMYKNFRKQTFNDILAVLHTKSIIYYNLHNILYSTTSLIISITLLAM